MQTFKPIGRAFGVGVLGVASVLSLWVSRTAIRHELESANRWVYGHFAAQTITMLAAFLLAGCALVVMAEAKRDSMIRRGVAGFAVAGMIGSVGLILSPFSTLEARVIGSHRHGGPFARGHTRQKPELVVTDAAVKRPEALTDDGAAAAEGASIPVAAETSSARCSCSPVKYEGLPSSGRHPAVDREYPEEAEAGEEEEPEEDEEYSAGGVRRVESSSSSSSYSSSSSSYSSTGSAAAAEGQAAAAEERAAAAAAQAEGEAAAAAAQAEAQGAAARARSEAYAGTD
jgi:hypothetical protein